VLPSQLPQPGFSPRKRHLAGLPAGRYWVLSDAKVDNKRLMWNEPVDIRSGEASLTLDQRNPMPVD
jgi:hypothetical protein